MSHYLLEAESLKSNQPQWEAYEHDASCVILAGPGSGKTKVITVKLARILAEDLLPPHQISCITFSTECASELTRRLRDLGVADTGRAFIGTVHSFCLRYILCPFLHLCKQGHPLEVAPESVQEDVFRESLGKLNIQNPPSDWSGAMKKHRRTVLDRTDKSKWTIGDKALTDLCITYESALVERGFVDFEMIETLSWELVSTHRWVRRFIIDRFPVFIIDEYQDLGSAFHSIALSLLREGVRLVAVGDPDQSLYGFLGAVPKHLDALLSEPRMRTFRLNLNYRSGSSIIRASGALLDEKRSYQPANEKNGKIITRRLPNGIDDQARFFAETIIPECISQDIIPGEIAAIYPSKTEGESVERALRSANIAFTRSDSSQWVRSRSPIVSFLRRCAAWCAGGWSKGDPSFRTISQEWCSLLPNLDGKSQDLTLRRLTDFLINSRSFSGASHEWLSLASRNVLSDESGEIISFSAGDREALKQITEACTGQGKLVGVSLATFGGVDYSPHRINLRTFHSSKGSEFDVVCLLGLDEGRIPTYYAGQRPETCNEARRAFYVGLTRARHTVYLLWSGWDLRKGRRHDNGPSRFLIQVANAIGEKLF